MPAMVGPFGNTGGPDCDSGLPSGSIQLAESSRRLAQSRGAERHARCMPISHMDYPIASRHTAARAHTASPLVLITEDAPAFRRLLASVLRGAGYRVLEAQNRMQILGLVGPATDPTSGKA